MKTPPQLPPIDDQELRRMFDAWQPEPDADLWPQILAESKPAKRKAVSLGWAAAASAALGGLLFVYFSSQEPSRQPMLAESKAPAAIEMQKPSLAPPMETPPPAKTQEGQPSSIQELAASYPVKRPLKIFVREERQAVERAEPSALASLETRTAQLEDDIAAPTWSTLIEAAPSPRVSRREVKVPAWLQYAQAVFKPAESVQVKRVRYGELEEDRLMVRLETRWLSYTHVADVSRY